MTKDVLVIVSGNQMEIGDEPIELVTSGSYYFKNGKHYVLYEEQAEDQGHITKNTVKFYDGHFEMTKRGGMNSFLVFDLGKQTSSIYNTLAGPLQIDAATNELSIEETEDEIRVKVKYSLDINHTFISQCEVNFKICSRM